LQSSREPRVNFGRRAWLSLKVISETRLLSSISGSVDSSSQDLIIKLRPHLSIHNPGLFLVIHLHPVRSCSLRLLQVDQAFTFPAPKAIAWPWKKEKEEAKVISRFRPLNLFISENPTSHLSRTSVKNRSLDVWKISLSELRILPCGSVKFYL
jgi:hypothetical protein